VNGEVYIYHAIEEVAWDSGIRPPDRYYDRRFAPYKRAQKRIQERIHPHYDLELWLCYNVPGAYKVIYKIHSREQVQAYRHRWLDALIKEFETKGD
jgi:hypothetical protein